MQNSPLLTLNRTFCPKTVIYKSDGFGRDFYISKNSGGFQIQEPTPVTTNQILTYQPKFSIK